MTALALLTTHFVADFILQSDWMATNKSKRWDALALHVTIYSACFLPFGLVFAGVTWALHFVTDAITSRITSRLWFFRYELMRDAWMPIDGKRHWFFVAIGADQLIHAYCLLLCANWLL